MNRILVMLALLTALCVGQNSNICLYSGNDKKTLKPLMIHNSNCPTNTSYCMNAIYKYGNYQYNGVAALKPVKGEVVNFLTQDDSGNIDFVVMVNANVQITSKVWVQITGADPTDILLQDDPASGDTWLWNKPANTGNFSWTTQPGYTDGVVIGHINFIDNYCVKTSFTQAQSAITNVSMLSGSISNVSRVISLPYTSGQTFSFCQYPVTGDNSTDASCPNAKDGSVSIWIVFGPAAVSYQWFDSNGVLIASTANVTGLGAGTYTVAVNDTSSNGCNAMRTIVVNEHQLLGAIVTTTPFNCSTKGSASAAPNGGSSGFTYTWYQVGNPTALGTGTKITGLNNGNYYVSVTDSCSSSANTSFTVGTTGCCGDGICQDNKNETCGKAKYCLADCGICCPSGTIVNGNKCQVCPAGTRSTVVPQATTCTNCPANTFNAGGNDTCAPCPDNYQSAAGSGKCVRCPAGQVRISNDTSCHSCTAGTYAPACDNSACTNCPAGTISADGSSFCTTCSAGTFSTAGSSTCSTCSAGSYSSAGAASCTGCPSDTTSAAGATHVLSCN